MLRRVKLNLLVLVSIVLLIFAALFIVNMICRANPNPKVSDRFDAYLRPGILLLLLPFRLAGQSGFLFHQSWPTFILGTYAYFGAMLLYSTSFAIVLFAIYRLLRKALKMEKPQPTPASSNATESPVETNRCAVPSVSGKLRALGALYLTLGGMFIFLVAVAPGLIKPTAPEYHPPYCCEALECIHGYKTAPDGGLYCAKYPPKEILDAGISPSVKNARLIAGAAFGVIGLIFAVSTGISGLLWLFGLWIPPKPRPWYAVLCSAAPLIVVFFWLVSGYLKCVYPMTPM
jgi:hypothetical protein